ncbi:hypothetical protein IP68_04920 [Blastomonas sp. AAP25]|uniref:hypothetical protein n=1 Tax=Blastomonas sp. AAP25 TaxID=1523416 RepID=UPI0006B8CBE7|nr:hypothetical protein [Blastomonas sp. AAP25]KPF75875.1 hypothetical protein IP68_04920 [Blastomonas sp. AAP25]
MSLVPTTVAEWLTGRAIYAQSEDGSLRASWGDVAIESEVLSPIAAAADASAEADRQLAFLGQPLAEEVVEVDGERVGLLGTCQRIVCDRAGYALGPTVLIVGAEEQDGGTTRLTVLRPMGVNA